MTYNPNPLTAVWYDALSVRQHLEETLPENDPLVQRLNELTDQELDTAAIATVINGPNSWEAYHINAVDIAVKALKYHDVSVQTS